MREERIPLVTKLLEERPWCQRCSHPDGHMIYMVRSTVIHEKKLRSAGGSITDEANLAALCDDCHGEVHASPEQARKDGWLIGRFDGTNDGG